MIIDKCPHCNKQHVQTSEHFQINNGSPGQRWFIERCQNPVCKMTILLTVDKEGSILKMHPPTSFELNPKIVVDDEIRNDFEEAGLCLGAGCNKASMVMSRRTLQRILKEQGCTQKTLVAQINHAIKENILRSQFHELAEEIREYGNLGAHPDDNQLGNATPENAKQVLEFVRVLIDEYYLLPAQVDGLRKKRESANDS